MGVRASGVCRVEHVMGMPIVADVRDRVALDVLDSLFAWFVSVDETFSTFKHESEISRLRRGELTLDRADRDVREVLARCEQLRIATGGYFDAGACSPAGIDPSGLVKGWAVDRAADLLDAAGVRNYAINAGGDIRLRGRAVPLPAWRVGIQHPLRRDRLAKVLESTDLAIATSGAYERGEHVVDPHTGRLPSGILSVTITGPDLATADAYATAAYAMGVDAAAWIAGLDGYEALTILADGRVISTLGFPGVERDGPALAG
jgi:thiamine biosynthesis lipoprotein